MTLKELEKQYKYKQLIWKTSIRFKPTKWKRFWAWVWYLIAFPWVWLFYNIRDWRTAIGIKAIFNKIKNREKKSHKKNNGKNENNFEKNVENMQKSEK